MPDDVRHLRELLRRAEQAPSQFPEWLCAGASRELVLLLDRPGPDRRRAVTLELGRRIEQLRGQRMTRGAICARLGISTHQFHRAEAVLRVSRRTGER